jgi:hypothetical protein
MYFDKTLNKLDIYFNENGNDKYIAYTIPSTPKGVIFFGLILTIT